MKWNNMTKKLLFLDSPNQFMCDIGFGYIKQLSMITFGTCVELKTNTHLLLLLMSSFIGNFKKGNTIY